MRLYLEGYIEVEQEFGKRPEKSGIEIQIESSCISDSYVILTFANESITVNASELRKALLAF